MEHFTFIKYKVINRGENKPANLLATLATKFVLKKEKMTLRIEKQPGLVQDELCFLKIDANPCKKQWLKGSVLG